MEGWSDVSIRSLCDKLIDIYARVETRGAAGSATYTYPTLTKQIRSRIQPATSSQRTIALQRDDEITHIMYFPDDPEVDDGDRIVFEGRNFDVTSKATNTDEQGRLWRIEALETGQQQ